jgi:muramoyltetrapeptide carboxypeptidase
VTPQIIKPHRLLPGDLVGVVAPAATVEREFLQQGVQALCNLGYKVKVSDKALDRDGILAGNDRQRSFELMRFFLDPAIKAIFTARAGYGSGRLLPLLDFSAIAANPKIFLGFSDQTFVLNAIVQHSHMVSFHGPMVSIDLARGVSTRSLDHLRQLLAGNLNGAQYQARDVIHPGDAQGEVIGGCLSVLVAMLATPYVPDFSGKILFLEDVGEKAYRIDRMLVQLKQAGALRSVAGIVFGGVSAVDGSEQEQALISEFIAEQTADLGCPVLSGVEVGHRTENFALPLGVRARLDSRSRKLMLLESPVC